MIKEEMLYTDEGWLNVPYIIDNSRPFLYIMGGRGTGKTYGILKYMVDRKSKFIYMRRTASAADMIGNNDFNPLKPVCDDNGYQIGVFPCVKKIRGYYAYNITPDGDTKQCGEPIGYICALSTFNNLRGISAESVKIAFYDEFCPEENERPIKGEAKLFSDVYETINRNRELKGEPPLKMICACNANDLSSPIFVERGLVRVLERLKKDGRQVWENDTTTIIRLQKSPISDKKRGTALYKATKDSNYAKMAIDNTFEKEYNDKIARRNLMEYRPLCTIGKLTIYRHKARREYFVSFVSAGGCRKFADHGTELEKWKINYRNIYIAYIDGRVLFSEALAEIMLLKYFGKG